jgi:hypothetical protein
MDCKHCGKPIQRVRRRPEWEHTESRLLYCWKDGHINRDERAEPVSGSPPARPGEEGGPT